MASTSTSGWTTRPLGDLAEFRSGGTPNKAISEYWNGSIPWITARDMKSMRIARSRYAVTEAGAAQVTLTPAGSVLVLVRGMGLFKDLPVVLCDRLMTFNQDIKSLVPRRGIDGEFLAFALVARKAEILRHVDYAGHGTGRLATHALKAMPMPVPPPHEQRRIADILATWDRAVRKFRELQASTQSQKRGLLHMLLTGDRQPADAKNHHWRDARIGDVARVIMSNVDKRTIVGEHPVKLCNYTDVYHNRVLHPRMPMMRATATSSEIAKFRLHAQDVVITKDSEDPNDIAVSAFVEATAPNFVCGYHLAILRPGPRVDGRFLKYYLDLPQVRAYFGSRANGATRFGLTVASINDARISMPQLREQRKIAQTLTTWDKMLDSLQSEERALTDQRRGIMYELFDRSHSGVDT